MGTEPPKLPVSTVIMEGLALVTGPGSAFFAHESLAAEADDEFDRFRASSRSPWRQRRACHPRCLSVLVRALIRRCAYMAVGDASAHDASVDGGRTGLERKISGRGVGLKNVLGGTGTQ